MSKNKKLFREEMPDGSFKEYEVDKFSSDGQKNFYLLGKIQDKLVDLSESYIMLKEGESSLIAKIKAELSDESLVKEQDDNGNKDGKKQD